jgi:flagellar hook-associated protein FlgK
MADILSISSSAVGVYQRVLSTVSDNIANVGNPDFVRQDASVTQLPSQFDGRSYQGSGAIFNGVRRQYDEFIEYQLRQAKSNVQSSQTMVNYAEQVMDILGGQQTSLNSALDKFFSASSALASDPAANIARTNFLSAAQGIAARVRDISANFERFDAETQAASKTVVGKVNVLAQQLAQVNGQLFKQSSLEKQSASLLNQRDALLRDLSGYIDYQSSLEPNGVVKVSIGGAGSAGVLVEGSTVQTVDVQFKAGGVDQVDLVLDPWGKQSRILSGITGGEYGGLVEFRSRMLEPAMAQLDSFTKTFATAVNQVHQSGVDANGQSGQALFDFTPNLSYTKIGSQNTTQVKATVTNPELLAGQSVNIAFDALAGKTYSVSLTGPFVAGDQIEVSLNGRSRLMTVAGSNPSVESVMRDLRTFIDSDAGGGANADLGFGTQLRTSVGIKGELIISSPVLSDYQLNLAVSSEEGRAQTESSQGLWVANDPVTGQNVVGVHSLKLAGLSVEIGGVGKNGDQIIITPDGRPASSIRSLINEPTKVATAASFGVARGSQNLSTSRPVIEDATSSQLATFTERALGAKNALVNHAAVSAGMNWDTSRTMPASVVPAGVSNVTYYLNPSSSSAAELQIFTRDGRQIAGKPMPDSQALIDTSRAFQTGSTYSDAYINNTYRGVSVFYGARAKPEIVSPIGTDHLQRTAIKLDAKLVADFRLSLSGVNAIPAGAVTLNGAPMTAFAGGNGQDVVRWINQNSGATGIVATLDADGYLSITRPSSQQDGSIQLGFGTYLDAQGNTQASSPEILAKLGFRTTAQIDGVVGEDLVVFATGQGTTQLAATWEGQAWTPQEKRDQLRQQKLEVQFTTATHYIIKDTLADQIVAERDFQAGQPIDYAGLRMTFDQLPVAGDKFMVNGNQMAVGDNTNALRMIALQKAPLAGPDGSLTLSEAYLSLIDHFGNLTSESQLGLSSFQAIEQEAVNARESVSGVNLDEEAANLIRFQQAYQAAAKSMQVANQLFETLLQI